jgi:hypothetical protein
MSSQSNGRRSAAPSGKDQEPLGLADAVRAATREFTELTGHEPDAVTGAKSTEDGWSMLVDVVELERVPSTSSVLATYRVDVGQRGQLLSYERLRRFNRGATDPT